MPMVRIACAALAVAVCGLASQSRAGPLTLSNGTMVNLTDLTGSYDGPNISSSTAGSVSGSYCYGVQSASALGGTDPEVSVSYTEAPGGCDGAGGSGVSARLSYQFVYDPGPGGSTSPGTILMVASDAIVTTSTLANNKGGTAGDAYLSVSAFDATPVYAQENCANNLALSCYVNPFASTTQPITTTTFAVLPDVVYTVTMGVDAFPDSVGGPSSAMIDPEFFLEPGETGQNRLQQWCDSGRRAGAGKPVVTRGGVDWPAQPTLVACVRNIDRLL
jgi:hypothetical protein